MYGWGILYTSRPSARTQIASLRAFLPEGMTLQKLIRIELKTETMYDSALPSYYLTCWMDWDQPDEYFAET